MGEMVVALFSFLFQDWGDNQVRKSQHNESWIFIIFGFLSWPSASPSSLVASCGSYFQSLQGNNKNRDMFGRLLSGFVYFVSLIFCVHPNFGKPEIWYFLKNIYIRYILPITPFKVAPFRGPLRGGEEDIQQGRKDEQEGDIKGAAGEGVGHQPGFDISPTNIENNYYFLFASIGGQR